jgi:hypothetical protein
VGRGHVSLLADLDTRHSKPFRAILRRPRIYAQRSLESCSARQGDQVRGHEGALRSTRRVRPRGPAAPLLCAAPKAEAGASGPRRRL